MGGVAEGLRLTREADPCLRGARGLSRGSRSLAHQMSLEPVPGCGPGLGDPAEDENHSRWSREQTDSK